MSQLKPTSHLPSHKNNLSKSNQNKKLTGSNVGMRLLKIYMCGGEIWMQNGQYTPQTH